MKAYNKFFNFYQFRDGTFCDTNIKINFDNYIFLQAEFNKEDLDHWNIFFRVRCNNAKAKNAIKKAMAVLNDLIELDTLKCPIVNEYDKVMDRLDTRSMVVVMDFLEFFKQTSNQALHIVGSIRDHYVRFA